MGRGQPVIMARLPDAGASTGAYHHTWLGPGYVMRTPCDDRLLW